MAAGWVVLSLLVTGVVGCGGGRRARELRGRRAVAEREVQSLRDLVSRLERGENTLPPNDVVISVRESLIAELLLAQLPVTFDSADVRVRLDRGKVTCRGKPLVAIDGAVVISRGVSVGGDIHVVGGLDPIEFDQAKGTLRAGIAIDQVELKELGGFEGIVPEAALDELAIRLRGELQRLLPDVTIPVKIQRDIAVPGLTDGPVRLEATTLPLSARVSQVLAVDHSLWVSVHLEPGELSKGGQDAGRDEGGTR